LAANYITVVFCDWAGPFLKFQKICHIAARKLQFRFGSALKPAVFGFGLKTVTALITGYLKLRSYWIVIRLFLTLSLCELSVFAHVLQK